MIGGQFPIFVKDVGKLDKYAYTMDLDQHKTYHKINLIGLL